MLEGFVTAQCISAYVIHTHPKGCDYLLVRRCGHYLRGTWQMISGGVQEGEKAYEAALREIREETGIIPDRLYSADAVETFYMKSLDKITFVPVFVCFVDKKKEVILSDSEHDAYEWLSYDQATERLIFSEQRRIIRHIHENFFLKAPLDINLIEISF